MGDLARREYLAWANAYSRILSRLGSERDPVQHSELTLDAVITEGRRGG
jgi:hypothetical protein